MVKNSQEASRFDHRARRYAKVSTRIGGLALRHVRSRYLGGEPALGAQAVAKVLGSLKGPVMKIAQLLAAIPDILPPDYAAELAKLQMHAPPMGWPFVRRRMAAELGADWRSCFADFEPQAAAAASLGQVHHARLSSGIELACKLQYPDMASVVEADLRQLSLALSLLHRFDNAIDPSEIKIEITNRLKEELDYTREIKHMQLYHKMLAEESRIVVPQPVESLSTQRLICMTWLSGRPFMSLKQAPAELRNEVALTLFRAWYVPFYGYGVIHGDPHPGNYMLDEDNRLNLLDFGCIRVFPPAFVAAVIDLYHALCEDDKERAARAYSVWGFENLSQETIDVLNIWARFLYRPLMEDRVQTIQDEENGAYGPRVAGQVHKELRRLGSVRLPRAFVLMDRAAIGLGAVFTQLRAEINWYQLFHELISGFDVDALKNRQHAALDDSELL